MGALACPTVIPWGGGAGLEQSQNLVGLHFGKSGWAGPKGMRETRGVRYSIAGVPVRTGHLSRH